MIYMIKSVKTMLWKVLVQEYLIKIKKHYSRYKDKDKKIIWCIKTCNYICPWQLPCFGRVHDAAAFAISAAGIGGVANFKSSFDISCIWGHIALHGRFGVVVIEWAWKKHQAFQVNFHMMTSSNGNIFRVTGPLCGEFTGPGEFPTQRPVTRSFDVFFDLCLNKRLSKQS